MAYRDSRTVPREPIRWHTALTANMCLGAWSVFVFVGAGFRDALKGTCCVEMGEDCGFGGERRPCYFNGVAQCLTAFIDM